MERIKTLFTFRRFSEHQPAFSEASLRWMRFNETTNGFKTAFLRVNNRVLIWEEEFFRIIARQNGLDEGEIIDEQNASAASSGREAS